MKICLDKKLKDIFSKKNIRQIDDEGVYIGLSSDVQFSVLILPAYNKDFMIIVGESTLGLVINIIYDTRDPANTFDIYTNDFPKGNVHVIFRDSVYISQMQQEVAITIIPVEDIEYDIIFDGENIENLTPREIIDKKISSIPEDRHKTGLILQHSLYENSILGMQNDKKFKKGMFLDYKSIRKHALDIIEEFDVRTVSENVEASKLSGGNQQKLIVGREIYKNPKLIIAVQPTRGLDIGAIEYIHKRLIKERDSGKAVLLISLELDEVLGLSDRIGVMYDGNIVKVLDRCEFDENKVGVLMAGGSIDG